MMTNRLLFGITSHVKVGVQLRKLSGIGIVNSHNEFDPLEEVIVGKVEGSTIPEWHVSGKAVKKF